MSAITLKGGPADGHITDMTPTQTQMASKIIVPIDPGSFECKRFMQYVPKDVEIIGSAYMHFGQAVYRRDGEVAHHVANELHISIHADCEDCGTVGEGLDRLYEEIEL